MKYTFYSKKLGRDVTFERPGRSYIYVDLSKNQNQNGTLGNQICNGGSLRGNTISYDYDDYDKFEKICRTWWKQYLRRQ